VKIKNTSTIPFELVLLINPQNKENIVKRYSLFDRIYGGKRIVVTKDRHNWIVKFGSPKQKEEIFEKKAEHWYFSTLEAMLVHLHDFMLKTGLGSLDMKEITRTLKQSRKEVADMAQYIEKKGVENGWK